MKIYTKTGDSGTTSLFGGKRVEKSTLRIKAYGEVDELNSVIGTVLAELQSPHVILSDSEGSRKRDSSSPSADQNDRRTINIVNKLLRIQNELFVLGTDLASPMDVKVKIPRVTKGFIVRLEKEIDVFQKNLPVLKNFILPGGGKVGAGFHLARTIARRAERSIVALSDEEKINHYALMYINRLSDWFFVLARYSNSINNIKEVQWRGRK